MAKQDFAAQLASKPLGYKLAVLGGVIVVLGFFYWQFFYSGLSDDVDKEKNQTRSLEAKFQRLLNDQKEWNRLVLEKKSLDEELRRNSVSLPASSELPSFFLHLQKQAAGAGVTLDNWRRLKESEVESYIRVPVAMQTTGTFYQINNYFKLLYETDRIITVENMHLDYIAANNDEVRLVAKFTASTFRLPDQPADTNLPETPEPIPPGGKGQVEDANKQRGQQLDNASGGAQPGGAKPAPGTPASGQPAKAAPAGGAKPPANAPAPKPAPPAPAGGQ